MKWYLKVIRQYSDFDGRARRKEFWMFFLFNMIFYYSLVILSIAVLGIQKEAGMVRWISTIYGLIMIIPSFAVSVRRMHDLEKSGWNCVVPIYNLILAFTEGDRRSNDYGSDPKGRDDFLDTNTLDGHLTG